MRFLNNKILQRVFLIYSALVLFICVFLIFNLFGDISLIEKMMPIILYNDYFWFLSILGVVFFILRLVANPKEVTIFELFAQVLIGFTLTFGVYSSAVFYFSDVKDSEIWNGYVKKAEYYEEWTQLVTYTQEECSGTGDQKVCVTVTKTRHDYHPPYWILHSSTGDEVRISKENYKNFVSHFKTEKKVEIFRPDQVSFGDGDKYVTDWHKGVNSVIPTATEHDYVNYYKAVKSINRNDFLLEKYASNLLSYPEVRNSTFGKISLDRVLVSNVDLPQKWKSDLSNNLSEKLVYLGSKKQVNLLVYVVNSDQNFLNALNEHWIGGKKNDVTLVLGVSEFPKLNWAGVLIFYGNEEIKIKLRDNILSLEDISNPNLISDIIEQNVLNYYTRVPMDELKGLTYSIRLPFWLVILTFILLLPPFIYVSMYFENNTLRN